MGLGREEEHPANALQMLAQGWPEEGGQSAVIENTCRPPQTNREISRLRSPSTRTPLVRDYGQLRLREQQSVL